MEDLAIGPGGALPMNTSGGNFGEASLCALATALVSNSKCIIDAHIRFPKLSDGGTM